jgi:hypothetical protein
MARALRAYGYVVTRETGNWRSASDLRSQLNRPPAAQLTTLLTGGEVQCSARHAAMTSRGHRRYATVGTFDLFTQSMFGGNRGTVTTTVDTVSLACR